MHHHSRVKTGYVPSVRYEARSPIFNFFLFYSTQSCAPLVVRSLTGMSSFSTSSQHFFDLPFLRVLPDDYHEVSKCLKY